MNNRSPLLKVENLKTYFYLSEGTVRAVDGTSFEIGRGQTLGVVGESGCGKSLTARSILGLIPRPGRIVDGKITFYPKHNKTQRPTPEAGIELTSLARDGEEMRHIRGSEIALVPQEPMASLSPVHTIGNQIMEAILLHQGGSKRDARKSAIDMLARVGIPDAARTIDRLPYELSGGMRQRAMIAMALSCQPSLLIADEPTTALDVTTEAQILRLMRKLQDEFGMAIMYITHNLGVVGQMAEDVIVMYLGKVVEKSDVDSLFRNPKHPYTQGLLRSVPQLGQKSQKRLFTIKGNVPDPSAIPSGCPFHPRCNHRIVGVCDVEEPPIVDVGNGHEVRCVLYR